MIRIISKRDGFRRCNVSHSKAASDYPDDRFSESEMETLRNEPMLVVLEGQEDNGEIAQTPDPKGMTIRELKDRLNKIGVDIPSEAKKLDLIGLLIAHTNKPPRE
ncbi:MAG: hypothetical protein CR984_02060 [Proteobacteria bacterium]|nr:MAG: hypothetical protein CR984_02060 [Pseudomonadota bacterium]